MKHILVAALAVVAVCLSGCSGSDGPPAQADPPPTVSPTSSGMTTQPGPPVMPPAAQQQTKAGAIAFARYFWDVVSFATSTGETHQLATLQAPWCRSCSSGLNWIRRIYAQHGTVAGGAHTTSVLAADRLPGDAKTGMAFSVVLRVKSDAETVTGAEDLNGTTKAAATKIVMAIQERDGRWEVAACEPAS